MVAGTLPASAWSADTDGRAALLDFEPPEEELPVESFPQADRTSAIAASVAIPARRVRELLDNGASPSWCPTRTVRPSDHARSPRSGGLGDVSVLMVLRRGDGPSRQAEGEVAVVVGGGRDVGRPEV